MRLPERVQEAWDTDWQPTRTGPMIGASCAFLLLGLLAATSEEGWIPLLDGVNLVFHEAGHPLFGLLGWEPLTILGGTLMQLLVPCLVWGSFWFRREALGAAVGWVWGFENLLNIGRYVADARAQILPLVGGGEHDWTDLLGRWGLLSEDQALGQGLRSLGWLGMLAGWAWLVWRWHTTRRA